MDDNMRVNEQEAVVAGVPAEDAGAAASKRVQKFSPKKRGYGATSITLAISAEDKKTVKMYALHKNMTVSDLLHEWIGEHCRE